MKTDYTSESGP